MCKYAIVILQKIKVLSMKNLQYYFISTLHYKCEYYYFVDNYT